MSSSPPPCQLCSASQDGRVGFFNLEQGLLGKMYSHASWVRCCATSPDGALVATGGNDTTVIISSIADRQPIKTIQVGSVVNAIAWRPRGDKIVVGCGNSGADGSVAVFDVSTGNKVATLAEHKSPAVLAVAVANNGKWIATQGGGGQDNSSWLLHLYSTKDFSLLTRVKLPQLASSLAFYPDSSHLVVAANTAAHVFSISADGKTLEKGLVLLHGDLVNAVAVSPDMRAIATGCYISGLVMVWAVSNGAKLKMLRGGEHSVLSICFLPDNIHLAVGGAATISVWALPITRVVARLEGHSHSVRCVSAVLV